MSWTDFINFINQIETGVLVIEATLLFSVLIVLVSMRRMLTRSLTKTSGLRDSDQIREWARESEAICQELSKNLEEKRAIVRRLIAQMDKKIQTFEILLRKSEGNERTLSQDGNGGDLGDQVSDLVKKGFDISEISRRLRLSKGEIELILNLKRYGEAPRSLP
ncbi:MAG: DUF6115 domain-containing protein [Thermodesulfobacteriota bacterium]